MQVQPVPGRMLDIINHVEVHQLTLRDTVNEGSDDPTGSDSSAGEASMPTVSATAVPRLLRGELSRMPSSTSSVDDESTSFTATVSSANGTTPGDESAASRAQPPASTSAPASAGRTAKRLEPSASRRVVLVTGPSQRDLEQWTERATSTMARTSTGNNARHMGSPQTSKRWLLEYKPVVSHSGWLIKRGHSIRNFKRRLFCILDHELVYHDSHDASDVRGRIDLSRPTTVQCLLRGGFRLSQGSYYMILYALDTQDRDVWIKKLQEQRVTLLPTSAETEKLIEQQSSSAEKNPLVFSGWLRKRGQMVKSTKRRWFELSTSTLTYYAHPQGGTKKGTLEITNARISHLDTLKTGERFSFAVRTSVRTLVLHADSQEERSLWVASLTSVAESTSTTANNTGGPGSLLESSDSFSSLGLDVADIGRMCTCNPTTTNAPRCDDSNGVSLDGACRRCMSSFISKTEDALVDVTREAQLILASPYSPEGSTTAAFLKEHMGRPITNAALRQFMSGLADYMAHTRLNELRVLGGRAGAMVNDLLADDSESSEFTDSILTIINEQIEERVFFPLYREVLTNLKDQTRADSKLLRGKIEVLRAKSQSFFGILPDNTSPSHWHAACVTLRDVDKSALPHAKRRQLVAAAREIYNVYHLEHPSHAPMNADEFIPAFIYVLIHSRLSDPVLLREMLTFFDLGGTQGEAAYFVTCLEIALEYIRSLVIACTVVLDASQRLGIEFARDHTLQVTHVTRLVPAGQAEASQAVSVGDVLVAINGLLVHEMELADVTKMVASTEGDLELCLLSMAEYELRFGGGRRLTASDNSSNVPPPVSDSSGQPVTGTAAAGASPSPPPPPVLVTAARSVSEPWR